MKTVLVAGGAGFLGSHFCEFLLKKEYRVICVDNLITGNEKNIEHLKQHKNFVYKKQDIITQFQVEEPIDFILNLASPASPIDYQKIPIETLDVGAIGTKNLLELAKEKNAVFLLASTSEVYGDPTVSPQKEAYWGNVNSIGPRSCYDEAKRFAEAITMAYHRVHKIRTRIVRIFNTYGPRMRNNDGRVVPTFLSQAVNNEPITIFGEGSQTRSFCYVDDLIEGIYLLMLSDTHEPVNIGNPNEFTIKELAKKVIALTNSRSKIIFKPLPQDDPKQRRPDITKAKTVLHWEPKIELDEGLKKMIEWLKIEAL